MGEIRKSTSSMEEKLTTLVTRISEVEGRLSFLEESDNHLKAKPSATKVVVAALRERLNDMEDWNRRNNFPFVSFPDGGKTRNPVMFLEKDLPKMLEMPTPSRGLLSALTELDQGWVGYVFCTPGKSQSRGTGLQILKS